MKKLVIFANCQCRALAQTLMESHEFSLCYEWDFLPAVQNLSKQHVPEMLAKVREADLFLYQPVSEDPTRPVEITSAFLREQVKPSATALSFPSLYFDGYFPHLQTLQGYISTLYLVHDYFIAYACAIGLTIEETLSLIQSEDLYPKDVSIRLVEASFNNLADRETEFDIDIKISRFLRDNYRREKLFNQFNHPKRPILKHIAEKILAKIGLEKPLLPEMGPSHMDEIMTPIYKSTYKNLELEFKEDFYTYSGTGNSRLTQLEVVRSFFDFYRQRNLPDIKRHVSEVKPFVVHIIENKRNSIGSKIRRSAMRYFSVVRNVFGPA
ncbi:MAG: WcbI family polysaccharide biosynthesis putative acetyltransferase [Desulfobulbaceae bacterium]|nr:WcbI family polysaccharide biosynthesis putative acetyltransferase [Desulfobulbaceae bacterium]